MKERPKRIDHNGTSFDEFLREEGMLEEAEAVAIKRVIAWQLRREMQRKRITKKVMAGRLRTSRSQLDRLLDPQYAGVTLGTLSRAAMVLGKRLKVQVIEAPVAARSLRKHPSHVALPVKPNKLAASRG
ncbi:MAG: Fis family transcriptional regulator [Candidatus Angelobacter sp.]